MIKRRSYILWLILFVSVIVTLVILIQTRITKADDGLGVLYQKDWKMFIIPETRWILVMDAEAWDKIVRFHFPNRTGTQILGIAIKDAVKGKVRYTILTPFYKEAFDDANTLEAVAGHEIMHIVDDHLGLPLFNPDKKEIK